MLFPLDKNEFKGLDLNYQYLGYYLKWDPQECFYYASKHTGFKPNSERTEGSYSKYSSIDDKIDNFHYYTTLFTIRYRKKQLMLLKKFRIKR